MLINLAISALSLFLAYELPIYFCWLVFLFLIPLYLQASKLRFWDGFAWGLLFYGIHLYPLAYILYERAQGQLRLLVYPFIIIFFALHSGVWFYVGNSGYKKQYTWAWPSATIAYFFWMQTMAFWIFDLCEGYPFALPIIPLGEYPCFLRLISVLHIYGYTILLIIAQWHVTQAKGRYKLLVLVWLFPFWAGCIVPEDPISNEHKACEHITCILPTSFDEYALYHPMDCAQEIAIALQKGVAQTKEPTCFVFPESTFPFAVQEHHIALWQSILDDNPHSVMIGTHKKCGKINKNCIVYFNSRRIIQTYEKNHSCIFTERTPFLMKCTQLGACLFPNTAHEVISYSGTYSLLYMESTHYILPVLCSELFFNDFSQLPYKEPILLFCNDSWFITNQMKNLMFLYTKIYAMIHQRYLYYISHSITALFPQTGRARALSTIA